MKYISSKNFSDLYYKALDQVYNNPDYISSPRGLKIKECLNVMMEIEDISSNLFKCNDKSATLATKYLKKEMCLYLNATNKVEDFAKASSFWLNIANQDNTVNSAYGNLIFNKSLKDGRSQFDWAFDCLRKDKDSRQAFMRFNNTTHQFDGVKDLPCTYYLIFHIRENKLNMTVSMRSNDIIRGLAYDVPSFILFQNLMYLRLKEVYTDLKIGTYSHISHSLHIYETDFELVEKRLKFGLIENKYPMPNNWRIIKSNDVDKLLKLKLYEDTTISKNFDMKENNNFYDWILS